MYVVPPSVVKKHWTGKGNAKKEEMIETAIKMGAKINTIKKGRPDDNVVDAVALATMLHSPLLSKVQVLGGRYFRRE